MKSQLIMIITFMGQMGLGGFAYAGGGGSGIHAIEVAIGAKCSGENIEITVLEQKDGVRFQVEGSVAGLVVNEVLGIYWDNDMYQKTIEPLSEGGYRLTAPSWKIEEYGSWWHKDSNPELLGLYRASVYNSATGRYEVVDERVTCVGL
jgi:hypothetical protein